LKLIKDHSLHPEFIVIDGYVFTDGISRPGLGFYLYNSLSCKTPVIGVAKSYLVLPGLLCIKLTIFLFFDK